MRDVHRRLMPVMLLVMPAVIAGCETLGQDLNDLAGSFMPPSPSEAGRWAVDPHDPDRRREGTLLLAGAPFGGTDKYTALYRDYVKNEANPLVKAVAIRALARHGTVADGPLVAEQLTHASVQVRWEAAKALQRIHNITIVPSLLNVVRDEDEQSDVRVDAALALGQYRQDIVVQTLVRALDDRDLAVAVSARRSMETLTGRDFGQDSAAWLNWYNAQTDDPFVGAQEYLYPTYDRRISWYEHLAFWIPREFEHPAPPIGLRPASERRTYSDEGDDDADAGDEGDDGSGADG